MTALVTRFFISDMSGIDAGLLKIVRFVSACFRCDAIDTAYVAVNTVRDIGDTLSFLKTLPVPRGKKLLALPVTPWGRYVEPLNALVMQAAFDGHEKVLFANTEHVPTDVNIAALDAHLAEDTLVVGAALEGFHDHVPGEHEMNGMRVPADAFMLVRVQMLALYNFIGVSEAPWIGCERFEDVGAPNDPGMKVAGIKEVPTFSLIQHMLGVENAKVKLVHVTGADRDASGIVGARKVLDEHKRASALTRAAKQMALANIPFGRVIHI